MEYTTNSLIAKFFESDFNSVLTLVSLYIFTEKADLHGLLCFLFSFGLPLTHLIKHALFLSMMAASAMDSCVFEVWPGLIE